MARPDRKTRGATEDKGPGRSPGSKNILPALLLAVAVVVGVTLYVLVGAFGDDAPGLSSGTAGQPAVSLGEKVARQMNDLLARTEKLRGSAMGRAGELKSLARGAYVQCVKLGEPYLAANPDDVQVRPLLAEAYAQLGQPDKARAMVRQTLALAPANARALWVQAQLERTAGDRAAAERLLARAAASPGADARIDRDYGLWLLRDGRPAEAVAPLTRAADAGRDDLNTELALVEALSRAGQYEQAERRIGRALRQSDRHPAALRAGVRVYRDLGRYDQAERLAEQLLEKLGPANPAAAETLMMLGALCSLQGQPLAAAEAFDQAAQHGPTHQAGLFQAAKSYYFARRYARAMDRIDRLAAQVPANAELAEWVRRIEDARFGSVEAGQGGEGSTGEGPASTVGSRPRTRPAGELFPPSWPGSPPADANASLPAWRVEMFDRPAAPGPAGQN